MINEEIKRNNRKITKKNTFTFTLAEQNKQLKIYYGMIINFFIFEVLCCSSNADKTYLLYKIDGTYCNNCYCW